MKGFRSIPNIGALFLGVFCAFAALHPAASQDRAELSIIHGWQDLKPMVERKSDPTRRSYVRAQQELYKEAGLDYVDIYFPSHSRLHHQLKIGKGGVDAWISSIQPSLKVLGVPVQPTTFPPLQLQFFGLVSNKPPTVENLQEKILVTVMGFKFSGLLDRLKMEKPSMRIVKAATHTAAFHMLKSGRAPYVLDYRGPALHAAQEVGIGAVSSTHIAEYPLFVYISRNHANLDQLLARLTAASKRILARREALTGKEKGQK